MFSIKKTPRDQKQIGHNDDRPFADGPAVLAAVAIRLAADARRLRLWSSVYYLEMAAQDLYRNLSAEEQGSLDPIVSKVTLPRK
jgi:hypothetical protein